MIQIVIPMAGEGSRFKNAGYDTPKPFLDILGVPMIKRVINNVKPDEQHRIILIYRREHLPFMEKYFSENDNIRGIILDEKTEGAACTVLAAEHLLDRNEPLVIANSDQLVTWNSREKLVRVPYGLQTNLFYKETNGIQDLINHSRMSTTSASIATFKASETKWSYVDSYMDHWCVPLVTRVAEKEVISKDATCGIYYYATARLFIEAAKRMIAANKRTKGEFYVCPVFNEILENLPTMRVTHYPVQAMYGLGTPEDYKAF
jgi:dTDP-glucose pyrophosphorylase